MDSYHVIKAEFKATLSAAVCLCLPAAFLLWAPTCGAQEVLPDAESTEAFAPDSGGGFRPALERFLGKNRAPSSAGSLYATFGGFAPGTGLSPGVRFWAPDGAGTSLDVLVSAARSLRGGDFLELRFGRIPYRTGEPPANRSELVHVARHASSRGPVARPLFFYGQAVRRRLESGRLFDPDGVSSSRLAVRDESISVVAGYALAPGLAVTANVGWLKARSTTLGVTGVVSPQQPEVPFELLDDRSPVLSTELEFLRTGVSLAFDRRRPGPFMPGGSLVQVSWSRYDERGSRAFSFDRFVVDTRGFMPLGGRHGLALRGLASADLTSNGARVPVFLQQTLGGSSTLRGYPGFRFRGTKMFALSGEYRFQAAKRIELAGFLDAGAINGVAGLQSSYGLGLRVHCSSSGVLRIDASRAAGATRLHIKFGQAF